VSDKLDIAGASLNAASGIINLVGDFLANRNASAEALAKAVEEKCAGLVSALRALDKRHADALDKLNEAIESVKQGS
jgi:hypothetical protein